MAEAGAAAPSARQKVLDAAVAVFLERGFEQCSMEQIAAAAGVVRRTVFNLFESKEALFRAAVEQAWAAMPIAEIGADEEAFADPVAGLTRMGLAISDFWAPPAAVAMVRLVIGESRRFPQLAQDYLSLGKLPALSALTGYLGEWDRRGELSVPDPDLAARQFIGMINEPLLWFRVLGQPGAPARKRRTHVVHEAVHTFLARYRPG
ncbi:TetR/AcrR family transcriptional regulator [Amycolatopsis ultiminotia]|uniref:TetR/AcrR family transcriptional regulator n=1 Tax=Amycolatopsis ultiminotia TaxID=543629 RepID=A0ABP6XCR1_9PSEU